MSRTIFAIGDIQGCADSLDRLLDQVQAHDPDEIWFAGDLVNRGPDSLASLRRVVGLGTTARCVLGNHDLHLLAAACGARAPGRRDTLDPILNAPDCTQLIDWLRRRPLAHLDRGHLLVHAGVHPDWSAEQTVALAQEVSSVLQGPDWVDFMHSMYGNAPARWDDDLRGDDRLRVIVNVLTRMRYIRRDGGLDLDFTGRPDERPANIRPWFDMPKRASAEVTVVFGHWSTLGLMLRTNLIALDTGCVWGGALSAVRLGSREVLQVSCPRAQDPLQD